MNWRIWFIFILCSLAGRPALAREEIPFNSHWLFQLGDVAGGASAALLEDGAWSPIDLPHTWNSADGTHKDYVRGVGWYRRHFQWSGVGRAFVRFQGSNQETEVFVNGVSLGRHEGGYTEFVFELTQNLHPGAGNVLAVRVSNAPNSDIAPLDADYTFFGGIYRPVSLLFTAPATISPLDHGASGIFVKPMTIAATQAVFAVRTEVLNPQDQKLDINVAIEDASGRVVAQSARPLVGDENTQVFTLNNPHLWAGRVDPYLYHAHVTLLVAGLPIDDLRQTFGLRHWHVDPAQGAELNGHPLRLHGVSFHQDREGKGWAITAADVNQDVNLLRELGANAVRLAHYPHSRQTLDLLDKAGIAAWAEIPVVNHIGLSAEFTRTTENQLVEMIRQEANHPAIFAWGLFNEVHADPGGLIARLNDLAHLEDPSRYTTGASNLPSEDPLHLITDLMAFNRYFGWYRGTPEDLGADLDRAHGLLRRLPVAVSEYGAGADPETHSSTLSRPDPSGRVHPEEWQAHIHEVQWPQIAARPFVWASFVWNLCDFAAPGRHEGVRDGINDKGLISYDRKIKKDAFYFYQAEWNPKPMVYITERRFTPRPAGPQTVRVYTNLASVELWLNGKSLGSRSGQTVLEWPAVKLSSGRNRIIARGAGLADQVEWEVP